MELKLASAMGRLGTETAFEVLAKAKALEAQGRSVIHLEIGEPDFDTPAHIVEAAKRALDAGYTHYGPAAGLPELREAIAEEISTSRGISVQADQVVVTPGGKPVMFYAILALCEAGDEIIYQNPGFPIYESMINFVGATAVPLPLLEEKGFAFSIDDLKARITPRTKMLVINSPANPTGGIIPKADLQAIAELALAHNFWVLSDEIYCRLQYEGTPASIAAEPGMADRTIILDGFSKTYAMTGWRMGYGVVPPNLAPSIVKLMVNSNSCTASFTQRAGVAAITGPQDAVDAMRAEFRRRRDAIVAALNAIPGVRCELPKGAFYAFPNISGTGLSEREMADRLLQEAGVATLAGTAFGEYGAGYLRLSYANSMENLMEATRRIGQFVESLAAVPAD
ncbi:MAG: pyridoxal phosphate-dependent aminotransferase [Thermomicrobia bacterium]|nr:pyridoxal phosphate-dependent aminotransferase [Thermomicrobia bacterium]